MTKKEIIIKAWVDLGIKTPFGICNNSGYFHGYFCNGLDEILDGFGIKENQIDYDLDFDGVGKFRPKSLIGIENNNGWIKIESIGDLPKENGLKCLFLNKNKMHTTYISDDVLYDSDWFFRRYTHWKLKNEFKYPLY
ncbi:hypothetical protein AAIP58_000085 [Flavobacterium psychrophilum]|nr:hypothetical protein [Flavobacterium psychrophilum]